MPSNQCYYMIIYKKISNNYSIHKMLLYSNHIFITGVQELLEQTMICINTQIISPSLTLSKLHLFSERLHTNLSPLPQEVESSLEGFCQVPGEVQP